MGDTKGDGIMKICLVEDCNRNAICHGMCDKHYRRVLKHGDVNHTRPDLKAKPRPCHTCGIEFTPSRKRKEARFCSKSCIGKSPEGKARAIKMGKDNAVKIGNALRNRGNGKSYRKYMTRHEHRIVAESMLGRPLIKGEIVHHKDGNKRNNDPKNLLVITQGQHMKEHGLTIPGIMPLWKPWEKRGKKCINLNQE